MSGDTFMTVCLGFGAVLLFLCFIEPPTRASQKTWVRVVFLLVSLVLAVLCFGTWWYTRKS